MRTLMLAVVAGLLFSMATFSGVTRTMSAELEEYSWFRVEPNLPHAVTGEKLVIKAGPAYRFMETSVIRDAGWGIEWVLNPKAAGARNRMFVYNMDDLQDHWSEIRAEFSNRPAKIAFMKQWNDEFYATPVKWNSAFAQTMENVWSTGTDWSQDASSVLAAATAEEILALSAYNQAMPILSSGTPRAIEMLGISTPNVSTWPDGEMVSMIANRNDDVLNVLRPTGEIFIAFDRIPVALRENDVVPPYEALSSEGAFGEKLGAEIPGWPFDSE